MKKLAIFLSFFLGLTAVSAYAMNKPGNFPDRPIILIVPYGTGGGSDQLSRALAFSLEKVVDVPIIVVNKPGGGGIAGLSDFFSARNDGYTLVQHIDDSATLYAAKKIKENPAVDWFPVCIVQITFSQLYISGKSKKFTDWDSVLQAMRTKKLTVANVSHMGSMERISMYLLEQSLNFKTTQVSFDKPAERYGALIGGHVDLLFEQPGDVKAYIKSKDMIPVLTFLNVRPEAFSDVPCLKDINANIEPLYRFRGFFIPKGVPLDRIKYLEWAFSEAWNSEAFQKFNISKYMHLINSYRNIEDGKKLVNDTVAFYEKMYKELGIIK